MSDLDWDDDDFEPPTNKEPVSDRWEGEDDENVVALQEDDTHDNDDKHTDDNKSTKEKKGKKKLKQIIAEREEQEKVKAQAMAEAQAAAQAARLAKRRNKV